MYEEQLFFYSIFCIPSKSLLLPSSPAQLVGAFCYFFPRRPYGQTNRGHTPPLQMHACLHFYRAEGAPTLYQVAI